MTTTTEPQAYPSRTNERAPLDADEHVAVAIVGGGPAGLTAAAELAPRVSGRVLVIEREVQAGGIPRHSDHPGYGIRDLRRFISGPAYARRLDAAARAAGAEILTEAMVTGWAGQTQMEVTSPTGRRLISADAVVLATGARERPRPARMIAGDRSAGVFTTGQLQNVVHLHHAPVGKRAVVVGAELVSWSAVVTLREAGCATVAMLSQYDRPEAYAAFTIPGRLGLRVPVHTRTRLVRINGKPRVESVVVEDIDTGHRHTLACDTVVMTGDWIPDNELVRSAGLDLDEATRGPVVDGSLATDRPGVFAIGNMVHPVDTADVAALDGTHVARPVLAWLDTRERRPASVPVQVAAPLRWIAPQRLDHTCPPPRGRLLTWSDAYVRLPQVSAIQDGRVLATRRLPWPCAPGRVFRIPASLLESADPGGGPVQVRLDNAPRSDR